MELGVQRTVARNVFIELRQELEDERVGAVLSSICEFRQMPQNFPYVQVDIRDILIGLAEPLHCDSQSSGFTMSR